jgi:DHA1 family tetracycline resistance protein-like MFS transporter
MFLSPRSYRTFLTIVLTYTLDLLGFSIVFPVLAPLLLNPHLHFFDPSVSVVERTTVLGLLFSVFGIAQFIGSPIAGAFADHFGRYKVFLATIGVSVLGYLLMAASIFYQDLTWVFIGRIVTGFCSGNVGLAQSATADLTNAENRGKAFSILIGIGSLGFVVGPWFGGKLGNPDWLSGSGAFLFAAIAALVNFLMVLFFFNETFKRKEEKIHLLTTIKDLRIVLHTKSLRTILTVLLFFSVGWAFFLVFSPTFLVQKFSLGSDMIGDIFAYMAFVWFFVAVFLNKELVGKFSLQSLIRVGMIAAVIGVALFVWPDHLWPYWIIIPIALFGGALSWANMNTLLSTTASEEMQGRAMGSASSMWSIGQIVAPLAAGPLAGWNLYSPLLLGAVILLLGFLYFDKATVFL